MRRSVSSSPDSQRFAKVTVPPEFSHEQCNKLAMTLAFVINEPCRTTAP